MTSSTDLLEELRPDQTAADPLASNTQSLEVDADAAKHRDRSAIGRWIVGVFLVVVVVLVLYVLVGPLVYSWDLIRTPAEHAATTLGSVLLPVVTLVLGYYFGTGDNPP